MIFIMAITGLVSCDNELTPLGEDFLGVDPDGVIQEISYDVKAYSVSVGPVQTNTFDSYPLGIYADPVYGNSTYDFVVQLNSQLNNPQIPEGSTLTEVRLEIPYFSRAVGREGEATIYELDSLYGNQPIDINVYRNNYFLTSLDAQDLSQRAVYYSDFESEINAIRGDVVLSIDNFIPSEDEIVVEEIDPTTNETTVVERKTPRLIANISLETWKDLFFITDVDGDITGVRPELANNNSFQDYFRGLYFNVESAGTSNGNLVHLDLRNGFIDFVIAIPDVNDVDNDQDTSETIDSNFRFNFSGNIAGFIQNDFDASIANAIQESNNAQSTDEGAENLYLKGGPGSLAVLELFGQATTDTQPEAPELSDLIENNWLINEASIEFYVNQDLVNAGTTEPNRILIYNYENNRLLADYDLSQNRAGLASNLRHLGPLQRIDDEDDTTAGVKYKITITQHLNNIIRGFTDNDRLAIVVSQDVSLIGNVEVKQGNPDLELIPESTAISHEGTILHGSNATDMTLRPRLKVFYSETQGN